MPMHRTSRRGRTAAIVAARNEADRIAETVAALREALPEAAIYVADDASTDGTAEAALAAGARGRRPPPPARQGRQRDRRRRGGAERRAAARDGPPLRRRPRGLGRGAW